mgnify:CR=1 FL=1
MLIRGDHDLNAVKAEKLPQVASPLRMATEEEIRAAIGAGPGSLGPVALPIPCIADRAVVKVADFSAGANQDGKHWFGLNWVRDLPLPEVADLRNVVAGDPSPDGVGRLTIARGIVRADSVTQVSLLSRLAAQGGARLLPVLQRLVPQIDPQAAPVPVLLALIGVLVSAGGEDAERLVADHVSRTRWRTPLRTWRLRSAGRAALRSIRQGGAPSARRGPARSPADRTGDER